jgi:hypothetical protein
LLFILVKTFSIEDNTNPIQTAKGKKSVDLLAMKMGRKGKLPISSRSISRTRASRFFPSERELCSPTLLADSIYTMRRRITSDVQFISFQQGTTEAKHNFLPLSQ